LARRCGLRLTEEYRVPAAGEWEEFLGNDLFAGEDALRLFGGGEQ
jgi:hypothetical protein